MNEYNVNHPEQEEEEWISRSQIKREAEALQKLGEKMVDLRPDQIEKLPIGDTLKAAVYEARRLSARGALRRQMQYIGKLMRNEDGEAIQAALDRFDVTKEAHNQVFHKLEKWRDRLISGEKDMLDMLLQTYPATDIQYVRQLVRNAQKETSQNKPPSAARKLFKYLRELEESES